MVSIIAPVYNVEQYLEACIDSVLRQTNADWELILVDDCSSDHTAEIAGRYVEADQRIKLIKLNHNYGPAHARNVGMENSRGEFLAFIDSDDTVNENYLEVLLSNAQLYKSDITWCQHCLIHTGNSGLKETRIVENNLPKGKLFNRNEAIALLFQRIPGFGSMWNKLYRREFVINNNIRINEARYRAEDWEFNINCFLKIDSLLTIADAPYNYIRRQASIMNTFREQDFGLMCESVRLLQRIERDNNVEVAKGAYAHEFLYSMLEYAVCACVKSTYGRSIIKYITCRAEYQFVAADYVKGFLPGSYAIMHYLMSHKYSNMAYVYGRLLRFVK